MMKPTTAISRRIIFYLGLTLPVLWLLTTLFSAVAVYHEINEAGDTQQSQLARELLQVPLDGNAAFHRADLTLNPKMRGQIDDKEMGFAVWRRDGRLLVADDVGAALPFRGDFQGFENNGAWWKSHSWRIFYLNNGELFVAVSASRYERLHTALGAVWVQLALSLLMLPVLLWLIVRGVRRGMRPLLRVADELDRRDANSLTPLHLNVPAEIRPIINAANALLQRLDDALKREMRFTADASHELRSPLTALKVHTDVLSLTPLNDEQFLRVHTMQQSIERTQHLIEQLLILSRLDPISEPPDRTDIDWLDISSEVLHSVHLAAREKHIRLQRDIDGDWQTIFPLRGSALLLGILLRNLLDNAVRYAPEHSTVRLHFTSGKISVYNGGSGVAPADLARLRERFFRPAGQTAPGSGLGLSIVERIATLHRLTLHLDNLYDEQGKTVGFCAAVAITAVDTWQAEQAV